MAVCTTESTAQDTRIRRPTPEKRQTTQTGELTADQEKQGAVKKIPWTDLSPAAKNKIKGVVSTHSIFRRMPTQWIFCDPEMYSFLVEHPDIVVAFWEKLGVTQITLRETKDGRYYMKESTGTTAVAEVLHRTKDICIVHGRGRYLGPFLAKSYEGEVILILRSRFQRDENQEPCVVCDLDAFVRIDNVGADLFARLFAASLGKIADSNFEQTVAFVSHVSEAAAINPETVRNLGGKLTSVREDVRGEFEDVVDRVALRYFRRNGPSYFLAEKKPKPIADEEPPFTAYTSEWCPEEIRPNETTDRSFYTQTPKEYLFTYQDASKNIWKHHDESPMPSSAAVLSDQPPTDAPKVISGDADNDTPSENEKPVLKGRVIFGTPKIVRREQSSD